MPHRESSSRADARATINACIRTLYEDTLVPVREIARRITNLGRNEEAANEATAALPVGAHIRLVSN